MARLFVYLTLLAALAQRVLPEPVATAPPTAAPAEPRVGEPEPGAAEEPPEGYYAFVESPTATPPRVRPPPYRQTSAECDEGAGAGAAPRPHVSAHNLCGDLNRGAIPRNPMGRSVGGEPYPFELIRNHTLRFLSRTLPVLRADDTLPRVAHLAAAPTSAAAVAPYDHNRLEERTGHAAPAPPAPSPAPRDGRKFCDGGGVFCMLYRAINGEGSSAGVERREDPGPPAAAAPAPAPHPRYEGPPTPCPARVEYATPVFARNYQGVWRYVVQIPYEGYFTQTVEVTRCLQARCHYLEGGCLSSPRWVSLLVAELHYPQEYPLQQQQPQPQRADGAAEGADRVPHCDGHDDLGCFQVRLYYDWFLVPGSCKCWRPDYFARYVRRRHAGEL